MSKKVATPKTQHRSGRKEPEGGDRMKGVQHLSRTTPVSVKIDFASMPEHVKEDLAKATLEAVMRFMKRPDARAILDAEEEMLRREGSTLLDPRPSKKEAHRSSQS